MLNIRPVSDLRNKFTEISQIVHEQKEPVILTKNGTGDMVVLSLEAYSDLIFTNDIVEKLKAAELEAATTGTRLDFDKYMDDLEKKLKFKVAEKHV
jgi:prevent-host-death family protein